MREKYPRHVPRFIEYNIGDYLSDKILNGNFDMEEVLEVLALNIEDQYKLKLLEYTKDPVSVAVDSYSDELKLYIISNNFDITDLQWLLDSYAEMSEELQKVAEKLIIDNSKYIIDNKCTAIFDICKKIMSTTSLNYSDKLLVFSAAITNLSSSECEECLSLLKTKKYLSIFKGEKMYTLVKNEVNRRVLEEFKEYGAIESFDD